MQIEINLLRGFLLSALVTAGGCGPVITEASICQVAADPAHYEDRNVRLRATYVTDRLHSSYLMDMRCPTARLGLDYGNKDVVTTNVTEFKEAVAGDIRDLTLRRFDAELVGHVRTSPSKYNASIVVLDVLSFQRLSN